MKETIRAVRDLRRGPRVLMYHYFGAAPRSGDPDHLFVARRNLIAQLDVLDRHGWQPIDLNAYLAWLDGDVVPPRRYLLTIDDAHESVERIAAPLFAERGIPSVLFVPSGLIGGTVEWGGPEYREERLATSEVLRSLADSGMELGVHGYDHTRMVDMDADSLRRHVVQARDELAAATGTRPRAFAYPYGTHDAAARRAVAGAGYEVAFAVAREAGRFGKWRVGVDGDDSLSAFRFKLGPGYGVAALAGGRMPGLRHRARSVAGAIRSLRPAAAGEPGGAVGRPGGAAARGGGGVGEPGGAAGEPGGGAGPSAGGAGEPGGSATSGRGAR